MGFSVPPSELGPYFQSKKSSTVLGVSTAAKVVSAAGNRVGLVFSAGTTSAPIFVWPTSDLNTNTGLQLTTSEPILQLLFRDMGPWVQGEWWAFSSAGATLNILETYFGQNLGPRELGEEP